jgi:hypothetical protein
MVLTLEALKEKITWIERELAEVRRSLEQLTAAPQLWTKEHWPAGIQWVDRTGWKEWFGEWFQQMGITAQPMGAERLQALMIQEGVRPEDNLLSRGIIAMREE